MHKRMSPHGDYDHMGETINLVENFRVEKVIFNCGAFYKLVKNKYRTNSKLYIITKNKNRW